MRILPLLASGIAFRQGNYFLGAWNVWIASTRTFSPTLRVGRAVDSITSALTMASHLYLVLQRVPWSDPFLRTYLMSMAYSVTCLGYSIFVRKFDMESSLLYVNTFRVISDVSNILLYLK